MVTATSSHRKNSSSLRPGPHKDQVLTRIAPVNDQATAGGGHVRRRPPQDQQTSRSVDLEIGPQHAQGMPGAGHPKISTPEDQTTSSSGDPKIWPPRGPDATTSCRRRVRRQRGANAAPTRRQLDVNATSTRRQRDVSATSAPSLEPYAFMALRSPARTGTVRRLSAAGVGQTNWSLNAHGGR
ncbi:hypothetical protein ACFPRL_03015 [Pseudoclavibacter helvolus]